MVWHWNIFLANTGILIYLYVHYAQIFASLYCTENVKTPEYQQVQKLTDYQERNQLITFFLSKGSATKNARKTIATEVPNESIETSGLK